MLEILFLLGAVLFIGFLSNWLFERTRIPEPVLLILLGFVIGETGIFWLAPQGVDPALVKSLAPTFGALAIVFFVFEAGMRLNIAEVFWQISFSALFGLANILLSLLLCTVMLYFGFNWGLEATLITSAILAGPSALSTTAIINRFPMTSKVRNILNIEGVLATAIIPVMAMTAFQYPGFAAPSMELVQAMLGSFAFSFLLGALVGVAWINLLRRFKVTKFSYLLTAAVMLMLFSIDFSLTSIGVVSILVAGITIGNYDKLMDLLKMRWGFTLGESFTAPQDDIMMFIKTFFFAYIGLMLSASGLTVYTVIIGLMLTLCLLSARLVVVRVMNVLFKVTFMKEDFILAFMIPRDILSAALAVFAFRPAYATPMGFTAESIFIVILFSTLLTTLAVNYYEKSYRKTLLYKKEVVLKDGKQVLIRAMTSDDFGNLKKFINDLVSEGALIAFDRQLRSGADMDVMQDDLVKANKGESIFWIAEYKGKIIARAKAERLQFRERKNVMLSIYVASGFRGLGLGRMMLEMIIAEARKRYEPKNIYLSVLTNNKPAIKLYRKLGFKVLGRLPEWDQCGDEFVDEYYMILSPRKQKRRPNSS